MKWIPFDKAKPEVGDKILVAHLNVPLNVKPFWEISMAWVKESCYSDEGIYLTDGQGTYRDPDYWMPLPKNPPIPRYLTRNPKS